MFEELLKGIKVVVFDIDNTLLIWPHNKKGYDSKDCKARAFIPDEYWDIENACQNVYECAIFNTAAEQFIKEILLYNKNNKLAAKGIYTLSADACSFSMINKKACLETKMPEAFNSNNVLWCVEYEKNQTLDVLCAKHKCLPEQVLLIDDSINILSKADKKGYSILSISELMQIYIEKSQRPEG